MDHQLEDGAPQRGVVEGGRAAASLQDRTHLQASRHVVRDETTILWDNVKFNKCKTSQANSDTVLLIAK